LDNQIVVIIPAKGNSTRLRGKNIRNLNGKPLLEYTIRVAEEWGEYTSIYVNSEDDEVLDIASHCGAQPYKRPKKLSENDVMAVEVIKEQVKTLKLKPQDIILLMQVTCPLRKKDDIEKAFKIFQENGMSAPVVSVTEYEKAPEQAFFVNEENRLERKYPKNFNLITQKHKKAYRYNTCMVINTVKGFLKQEDTVGSNAIPYIMQPERSIDIDYDYQFKMAELLIKYQE